MCCKMVVYYLKVKSLIVWFFYVQPLSPSFIISYTPNLSNKRYKIPNSHAVLLNLDCQIYLKKQLKSKGPYLLPIFYKIC